MTPATETVLELPVTESPLELPPTFPKLALLKWLRDHKYVNELFHANTVLTSLTFAKLGGLVSRAGVVPDDKVTRQQPGGSVLDPFMGSGNIGLACDRGSIMSASRYCRNTSRERTDGLRVPFRTSAKIFPDNNLP